MDDLIRRSDAIDVVCGLDRSFVQYIEDIPSVQPEIIRCKDCEFYTEEERWCRRLGICGAFDPNGYCSHAERRDDE